MSQCPLSLRGTEPAYQGNVMKNLQRRKVEGAMSKITWMSVDDLKRERGKKNENENEAIK